MSRTFARAAFAGLALAAVASAHAGGNVYWSIGINAPLDPYGATIGTTISNAPPAPVVVRPAPVIVQPAPVYVPAPVYLPPPVYVRPAPIYYAPAPVVYAPPVLVPPRHVHHHHPGYHERPVYQARPAPVYVAPGHWCDERSRDGRWRDDRWRDERWRDRNDG